MTTINTLVETISNARAAAEISARNTCKELWTLLLQLPLPQIEDVDQYANTTDYFDGLVKAKIFGYSKLYTGTSKSGRRVFVYGGLSEGNVVLFERYTPGGTSPLIIISQNANCNSSNNPVETLAEMMIATSGVWMLKKEPVSPV